MDSAKVLHIRTISITIAKLDPLLVSNMLKVYLAPTTLRLTVRGEGIVLPKDPQALVWTARILGMLWTPQSVTCL